MTEPRPHREALSTAQAAEILSGENAPVDSTPTLLPRCSRRPVRAPPRLERPAGLTEREAQVIGLLARGLQTKQVARALGISVKTADRHVQNAYAKIGVSTRAAAALFAMEHGLATWGELPIGRTGERS
jgi:DNA-binding NarL/FixJ family response regulator